ncbi:DUF885 domain-containing protein [Adhaeribacter radiodurans]|uniref:DUF885 domain-containing protein n=1 Tax=Adhaeribacter radiodurans TaxID=2745197 RepID=A0A7L7LEX4_9BACT|nr:DUF885 domain-containing protein [Adhaeribacter radiodurans]QMU31234.1 DUF885 domain-containing protein [Adhaeribacter radiodurans]
MKKLLFPILLLTLAFGCNKKTGETNTARATGNLNLDTILKNYYEERLKLFPLEATAVADNRYNDQLPIDISESHRAEAKALFTKYLTQLKQLDTTSLQAQEELSYAIFKRDMELALEGLTFPEHLMPINQFWGLPLIMAQLGSGASYQPFKTVKDYDNFLGRITGFQVWGDTAVANMRRGMVAGYVLPKALTQKVLPQLKALVTNDPTKSIFFDPIKNIPKDIPATEKDRLTQAYTQAIKEKVVPTYKKLHDFMEQEYLPKSRTTSGISAIPNGDKYYNYMVRYWTTTDKTPDEIFNTGQQEVKRIRAEMEKVKEQVGFKGDLLAFFKFVQTNARFKPFKTDQQVLNAYHEIEKRMQPQLKQLFGRVPKSKFEVRQTEAFREASASAEYNPPAPDGSRPGVFYVPILQPQDYNSTETESLFLHEAIPGHHYQISLQYENVDLPKFRRFGWYGANGEGWALYTESLGKELGLYTDPYQYFGRLSNEMHRAIRLVVDAGLHSKGWTREQAIQFSKENEASDEQGIIAEIERYMAIPGQALSYKTGELKIRELRNRYQQQLGSKFKLSDFHDEILRDGVMPLAVLETKMNAWAADQK